ncbi:MAG: universal stress protein, partial [bacterium]|nr:universal stress protein [bacterium]
CSSELAACPLYHVHVHLGDPAREILKAIDVIGPNLVVMAIHGRRRHFPVGSVAERVIRNSRAPILIINPDAETP